MSEPQNGFSATWLGSMFSRDALPNDVVESTVLNITKFGTVFAAVIAAIAGALEVLGDGVQFTAGNWTVIVVALFTLVVVLFVFDMITRAYSTAHAARQMERFFGESVDPMYLFHEPVHAEWNSDGDKYPPMDGSISGIRVSNGNFEILIGTPGVVPEWKVFEQVHDLKIKSKV